MKKFIINFSLLCLLVTIPAYIVNYIVDKGLKRSNLNDYAVWNDIYNSRINADVLLCGPSRMEFIVSPAIMDSVLGMNTYNLGMAGYAFYMQNARFQVYMQHNKKPKYIIQSVDFNTLKNREDLFNYEQFLPYLDDTIVEEVTSHYKGAFTFPEKHYPLFKYNNHWDLIKEGIYSYFNKKGRAPRKDYKGFLASDAVWDSSFSEFKKANPNGIHTVIQQYCLDKFEQFLAYCQQNDIKVIMEFAPGYIGETEMELDSNMMVNKYRELSQKYNASLLDYRYDTICYQTKYFYNSQHLNKIGSRIFTEHLANDVKNIIASSK